MSATFPTKYSAVFNAKQGSLPNTEWYERVNTKVEVAKLVGCVFAVSFLPNLETAQQGRSVLLLVEQKLLVKEGKSGCA
jgi:hypothetical protein